ncbi:MAG TPA: phosphoribosylformylglycinamidine cyclo-ligase [Acidobacteriota bacterium]|nr:phosphoribosylformylglycinamidine cyclo-ligase [Acidobacteriota bacterium]
MKYSDSGVDIDRSNEAKRRIKSLVRSTFNEGVVGDIGAFGGMYRPDFLSLQKPILVSSVDGVGTKLKVAFMSGIHDTVGIDLVSHCTNDILVQGAFPLFFLDYIAAGRLEPLVIEQLVKGLAQGCRESQCVLIGGETAEMPDFYKPGEYDLAGFIVGMVDESKLLGSRKVERGDVLIGLRSSGLHTNGYSLARKIFFEKEKLSVNSYVESLGKTVAEELLLPHRNYLPVVKELVQSDDLHAMAHITGGGITENLNRVLPDDQDAAVQRGTWDILPVFRFLRERGQVEDEEMYRTFNMGIGLILVVDKERLSRVEDYLRARGEQYYLIGEVVAGTGKVRYV